ncbi:MAG: phosphatidylserine/phosphatidylglycerophosphate/cardiolipin synthase family protein [Cyanobacteria bacterium J06560_2]
MRLIGDILLWALAATIALAVSFIIVLYIRGAFRWRDLLHVERAIAPQDNRFALAIKSLTKSIETQGQVVGFWDTAQTIQQARIEAINRAQQSIQFETFMMTPGKRSQDFASAIARKATEGINVQILVDSFGARAIPSKYWHRLRSAGVQVVFFNPFDWQAPANFSGRTHRKLLIIDGQKVLIGGAGMSDLWDGEEKSDDTKSWLDMEVALTGPVVSVMSACFQRHWQGHKMPNGITGIDMEKIFPSNSFIDNNKDDAYPEKATNQTYSILVTPGSKPSYRSSSIETLKQMLIACARQRIWLSSPYFLPNESTRQLLINAKQAGVDVRILTTSVRSDKKPVYYASYEVYGDLLKAGIQIFEYQPSMLHAKMLIIDHEWVNTGSANFDYRSFLHNDELDICMRSPELISSVEKVFEKGFALSEQIGLKQWQQRSWLKHRLLGNAVRLVQWQL